MLSQMIEDSRGRAPDAIVAVLEFENRTLDIPISYG